ncbi:GDSL esterase/lipase At1g29670-like [Solanum pennellii]|uniref:GDSL esterase/lipase At1g29670-like n=1 Tax=Solanum pennellii TaxID=28526 RepID=A0ABM1GZG2_SOLPN|nr:GDSL esterase/lipase At1g29670-like [Solanum pennellii]
MSNTKMITCNNNVTILIIVNFITLVHGASKVPCYFIFGDSLLDNGNNNNLNTQAKANYPPYGIDFPNGPTGRFTNGRNMADILGQLLEFDNYIPPFASATGKEILQGVNYASGSAGIRNETGSHLGNRIYLDLQLENHHNTILRMVDLVGNRAATNAHLNTCLYIVGIGSNDYINNYLAPKHYSTNSLYTPSQYATLLVQQYGQQLKTLYEDGARKIALFGLPQIGCIPQELQKHNTRKCVDSTNEAIQLFNEKLKSLVTDLNTNFPQAKFTYINMYSISSLMSTLSFLNYPCCKVSTTTAEGQCVSGQAPCHLRAAHVFWDNFHPTENGNIIAVMRAYNAFLPSDSYPMDISHLIESG